MAIINNKRKLKITELDFEGIRTNLKDYLQDQDAFTDYDFEGSGMSVLIDLLAYNTHYLALNANMFANEMFLDTAALRSSVVSHAKMLGYEVRSARAPVARVNVSLLTTDPTKTMGAGTKFTTTVDGVSYQFVTASDHTAKNIGKVVDFNNIPIYEGTYVTQRVTVDTSNLEQRFLLNDNRADTTTLTVKVQNSATDSTTLSYTKVSDITQLTSESRVYFLQEVEKGQFQIYFGDGVISKSLVDGNIVILQYVVTNKSAANGAKSFTGPGTIDGVSDITITTAVRATGGAEPESINSIKTNAPLDYASQSRCVTTTDYETFIKRLFPQTQAVSVFGGEDGSYDQTLGVVSRPAYGKVFISIKSTTGQNLTTAQKRTLQQELKPFIVASITPEFVDPETLFVRMNTRFVYDPNKTTNSPETLVSKVVATINNYNTDNLKTFTGQYRASEISRLIDTTDTSILNNTTSVTVAKNLTPTLGQDRSYTVNFNNALLHPQDGYLASSGGVVSSTTFFVGDDTSTIYQFDDDGFGNLRRFTFVGTTRSYVDSTAGTIDYDTGNIIINTLSINSVGLVDGAASRDIRFVITPRSSDIVPIRNQIIEIDTQNSTVTGVVDQRAASGTSALVSGTITTTTTSSPTSGGTTTSTTSNSGGTTTSTTSNSY